MHMVKAGLAILAALVLAACAGNGYSGAGVAATDQEMVPGGPDEMNDSTGTAIP